MSLIITGFILGIYSFARKVVKNEPLKGQINSLLDTTNNKLSLFKNEKPKLLLEKLSNISKKGFLYSLILGALILLFPENIEIQLIKLLAPIFILNVILHSSISWIQNHNKTFKEFFFNFQMIGLLFSPLLFYFFDIYSQTDMKISSIFDPFKNVIENIGLVYFQIIWLVTIIMFLYIGAIIIALPIYLILYTLIIITAYFIKTIEKYINNHILDGIVGITIILLSFYKIFI